MTTPSGKKSAGLSAPWPQMPGAGFDSLLQAQAKAAEIWMQSWNKLAGESAAFMSRRLNQDMDIVGKIMACRNPLELLQVQTEFMQKALVDYVNETTKMMDMETDAQVAEMQALDEGVRKAGK